jgi:hypothetical protein
MKALFISIVILFVGCSALSRIGTEKFFEVKLQSLQMWFDAMPKIEAKSKFHINLKYFIKNISAQNLEIDSLVYDLILSKGEKIIFRDDKFKSTKLHSGEIVQIEEKTLSSEINDPISKTDRKADLFLNVYFKVRDEKFFYRIFLKSQEFEIVY